MTVYTGYPARKVIKYFKEIYNIRILQFSTPLRTHVFINLRTGTFLISHTGTDSSLVAPPYRGEGV
jgi:hypothetical protein